MLSRLFPIVILLSLTPAFAQRPTKFSVIEATIPQMQEALRKKKVTSRQLVQQYLERIATYEDLLNASLYVNPRALAEADQLDLERKQGRLRGPLHGIPIALKDNIHTTDMPTTGGALAFTGYTPPYEATLTKNLRASGAIIIAKTGMTELANWVAGGPTPMPTNYNSVGSYGFNPYDPRRDPRPTADGRPVLMTGGSSSGIGTAANFWAANIGTETSGSILSPANQNRLAAIKPTVGRVSRYGIIPITADQDTAGPMAKSVADTAVLLGVLESLDPNDPATKRCTPPAKNDYTKFLRRDGLKGARIGIPRASFYDRQDPAAAQVMADAIAVLVKEGAVIIDPVDLPSVTSRAFQRWGTCSGVNGAKGKDAECSTVFKYGMKRDFNAWLATLGPTAPVKTLTELREWNLAHSAAGSLKYGQSNLDISDEMDLVADRARYDADRAKDIQLSAAEGIDVAMTTNKLDALLFPGGAGAGIAAKPGYPTVMVPFGEVPNDLKPPAPEGFNPKPSPLAVSFTGTACSEPRLIELGYSFEQATKRRFPPPAVHPK
ncbi:MAG: amidase family protein [Acidobacteria bacterium]|nr:amidase family protein [Acidobacteriota bacterium]